jgi:hypothetical protein
MDDWTSNSYDWMSPTSGGGYASAPVDNTGGFGWSGSSGGSWDSLIGGFFGLANTALKADTAVKLQKSADGRSYLEGQPAVMPAPRPSSALSIPTELIVLAAVVGFVMLAKD